MAVYDNSRYITTPLYTRGPQETPTLKVRKRCEFNLEDAEIYTWTSSDTLDGVAYAFYEIADLRWAILDANPQYRTEFDIEVGDEIYIPAFEEVVGYIDGDD